MIEWVPAARLDVENVAVPPLSVPEPIVVPPSLKVTEPVGVPLPGGLTAVTVAVKVTELPETEGLTDESSAVLVESWSISCVTVFDVEVRKFESPPYTPVMEWGVPATVRDDVENVATPPVSVPEPMVVAPSLKVTLPVGVPVPGLVAVTVAVKVTDWPDADGLSDESSAVVVEAWLTVWETVFEVEVVKFVSPP